MVSIAHEGAPHDLTFISLRRKGFNQDFIKRYLCNALRPARPCTVFIFPRGLCSRRRGESAFRVFFSEKCLNPRDWTSDSHRCQRSAYLVSSWRVEKFIITPKLPNRDGLNKISDGPWPEFEYFCFAFADLLYKNSRCFCFPILRDTRFEITNCCLPLLRATPF